MDRGYVGRVTLVRFMSSSIYVVHLMSRVRQSVRSPPAGRTAAGLGRDLCFRRTSLVFQWYGPRQGHALSAGSGCAARLPEIAR